MPRSTGVAILWTLLTLFGSHPAMACVPGQKPEAARAGTVEPATAGKTGQRAFGADYSHLISLDVCIYDSDCNPWLTPDEQEIFFIRYSGQYGPADEGHQGSWDIYHAEWDPVAETWGPVTNLGPNVNSVHADRRPTTTADGDTLFFSRQAIYYSIRTAGEFSPAVELFEGTDPCLSNDGQRLYFVRNKDIWVARRGPSGAINDWIGHQSIGPPVNTANSEVRPYISRDDSLLLFSDFGGVRPGGYGGADLWVSRWTGTGWSEPENVGPPVNLDRPACSPWLSGDRKRLYTASESFEGSRGCEDLWISYRDSLPPPAETAGTPGVWTKLGELEGAWNVYDLVEDGDGVLFAATAPSGTVYRSFDDGESWEATAPLTGALFVHSLLAASDGTLYAGVYPSGRVYRSTDKGDSWILSGDLAVATAVRALLETSDGRILAGTSPVCRIYESTDGGSSWSFLSTPPGLASSVSTLFEDSGGVLMAGGWGDPMRSDDGGISWSPMLLFSGMASIESFLEDSYGRLWMTGWSHDDGSLVTSSDDGGSTWNPGGDVGHGVVSAVRIYDIVEPGPGELIVGFQPGPDTVACRSTDGGASWQPQGSLEGTHEILRFLKRGNGDVLAATTPNGDIFRYTPEGATVPGEEAEEDRFGVAAVLGGDPNPFRDRTRIRYQIPADGEILLSIVDAQARRVRRLKEGVVPAGRHELLWDGRDDQGRPVASGVYFVRMRAGGSVTFQKLVVLR